MGKRKSGADAVFDIAARMPWWMGVAIALVIYIALHALAGKEVPLSTKPGEIGVSVVLQAVKSMAVVGQWLIPALLLTGAGASYFRQRKRQALHDDVAQRGAQSPFAAMSWREFEDLVAEHFRRRGFAVSQTGRGGADGGVDVWLTRGADRYLVQCKHWRALRVGVEPVRELYGVLHAQRAAGGFVVTSGRFTDEAKRFAEGREIELIDGDALARSIRSRASPDQPQRAADRPASAAATAAPSGPSTPAATPACPSCGAAMQRRKARRGQTAGQEFWGCTAYPACRGTRPI